MASQTRGRGVCRDFRLGGWGQQQKDREGVPSLIIIIIMPMYLRTMSLCWVAGRPLFEGSVGRV